MRTSNVAGALGSEDRVLAAVPDRAVAAVPYTDKCGDGRGERDRQVVL